MKRTTFLIAALLSSVLLIASDQRPKITGVAYVRIAAKDPTISHRFYGQTLRFPSTVCGKTCTRYQVSETQHIEVVNAGSDPGGLILVAFRTSDAEALRAYLASHKGKVSTAIHQDSDGGKQFEIADPEGHRIVFVQPPKAALVPKASGVSQRIIHAGFVVKDRAAMDSFYKDVLGFRLYWQGGMKDGVSDWVDMQVPDGGDWLEYMLNVGPDADHRVLGIVNHFALGTESVRNADVELQKTGWKPANKEKPHIGRDGKWQLNLYDPDETRVELMEFVPTQKPCCSDYVGPHPKQ